MQYEVTANGAPLTVRRRPVREYDIKTRSGEIWKHVADDFSFAILTGTGPVTFRVTPDRPFRSVKLRPLSAGIEPVREGGSVVFTVDRPRTLSLELDGDLSSPLFLFYSEKTPVPEKVDYYFGPGEHDAGNLVLRSGQTVYLEVGAWVYGSISAEGAEGIAVLGEGVLSGERAHRDTERREAASETAWSGYAGRILVDLVRCRNVRLGRVTLYDGMFWQCRLLDVEDAAADGLRVLSMNPSGDGLDVCNSRRVRVENCFFRTNDDCVAVKALFNVTGGAEPKVVEDVCVRGCVCWSATHGNALEIGYSTCVSEIRNVRFSDCDIIHCEREGYQSGGAITIHNGDCADIHDVVYEDIRVEDAREKLFDLKICKAVWSHLPCRGKIRNVFFKDIALVDGPFPPSVIRGFESASSEFAVKHEGDGRLWVVRDLRGEGTLRDITFENFTVYGRRVTDALEAKCVTEIATNVVFR